MKEVEIYISKFPENTQAALTTIRTLISDLVPNAVETISYGMPAYKLNGKPLIYFAAYKNHIGVYATPSGHQEFKKELCSYKQGKGSVQFQLSEEIPFDLIGKIIVFNQKAILTNVK